MTEPVTAVPMDVGTGSAVGTEGAPARGEALETGRARQGFLANVVSNVVYVGANVFTNLWMTPFLIGHLGIAAFGMVQLVNTVVSYISIVTSALDSALSRFVAIDLGRRDAPAANRTFNSALFGLIGIMAALIPLVLIVAVYFPAIFAVPEGWEADSSRLFLLVASSFLITVLGGCFAISCFVHSRFVYSNLVYLAGLVSRVALIIVLYSLFASRLWYAGMAALAAALVNLVGFVFWWHKLTPELHISVAAFDQTRLRSMAGMGGWVMVNMAGAALLGRVDLIVVNAYFGPAMTGGYASAAQFSMLMEHLVTAASAVIRPVILLKYAQGDQVGLQRLAAQSVKLLGLALGLPVGLLCGYASPLLSVWLGPSYEYLAVLLIVIIFHHGLNLSVRPLLHVQNAYNKVRWPGIVTLLSGALNVGLAILFARWNRWGAVGVAVATAIAWTAKNGIYMPIYTARIMRLRWWALLPSLIASIVGTALAWGLAYGASLVRRPDSWITLAASMVAVSLIYGLVIWVGGLSRGDRALLKSFIPARLRPHDASLSTR